LLRRSPATPNSTASPAPTPEALLEPDLAFHRRIAEATGNALLAYIGNMLSLALRESIKLSSRHPNTHALSLPRHKAILTALQHRDPLGARQATLVQLDETLGDLSEVLEDPCIQEDLSGTDLRLC
jgi:DNA-binding FadR family transcriptional regulator